MDTPILFQEEKPSVTCQLCLKGDGTHGQIRSFKTQYGYRMHLRLIHGLKQRDSKLVKVRP